MNITISHEGNTRKQGIICFIRKFNVSENFPSINLQEVFDFMQVTIFILTIQFNRRFGKKYESIFQIYLKIVSKNEFLIYLCRINRA